MLSVVDKISRFRGEAALYHKQTAFLVHHTVLPLGCGARIFQ
jgi:hypothetical protein